MKRNREGGMGSERERDAEKQRKTVRVAQFGWNLPWASNSGGTLLRGMGAPPPKSAVRSRRLLVARQFLTNHTSYQRNLQISPELQQLLGNFLRVFFPPFWANNGSQRKKTRWLCKSTEDISTCKIPLVTSLYPPRICKSRKCNAVALALLKMRSHKPVNWFFRGKRLMGPDKARHQAELSRTRTLIGDSEATDALSQLRGRKGS